MRDVHLGRTLLATARMAIASELGRAVGAWPEHAALASFGATFVTLMKSDGLRGCIGTLQARRALRDDVRINAVAAAFDSTAARLEVPGSTLRLALTDRGAHVVP